MDGLRYDFSHEKASTFGDGVWLGLMQYLDWAMARCEGGDELVCEEDSECDEWGGFYGGSGIPIWSACLLRRGVC